MMLFESSHWFFLLRLVPGCPQVSPCFPVSYTLLCNILLLWPCLHYISYHSSYHYSKNVSCISFYKCSSVICLDPSFVCPSCIAHLTKATSQCLGHLLIYLLLIFHCWTRSSIFNLLLRQFAMQELMNDLHSLFDKLLMISIFHAVHSQTTTIVFTCSKNQMSTSSIWQQSTSRYTSLLT